YYQPPNSLIYQQIVGVPPFAPIFNFFNVSLSDPYNVSGGGTDPFPTNWSAQPAFHGTFPWWSSLVFTDTKSASSHANDSGLESDGRARFRGGLDAACRLCGQ